MLEEIWEKYPKQIIISGIIVTISVIFISILVISGHSNRTNDPSMLGIESSSSDFKQNQVKSTNVTSGQGPASQVSTKHTSKMMIDVKGAVKSPGVYEVKTGMRVVDAIEMADGLTKSADRKNINLALQLSDQQVVYIPVKGEIKDADPTKLNGPSTSTGDATGSTDASGDGTIVNLNSATKEELLNLNGIGDKKADQIINYREEQGEFKSIEDLKNVQGIGDKIFDELKNSVTV